MRVVIAEPFAESGQDVLHQRGIDVISYVGRSRRELLDGLRDVEALIVRSETQVDRDLLAHAPNMRVVGRAGAGVDAIDVDAATEAGILVLNTPAANTVAATEHTMALLLALMRNVPAANASLRNGEWERSPFIGRELYGKTLGIIGLGRIGGGIAVRARAFGMAVVAHDPYIPQARAESVHVELTSFEDLLRRADVVTLHVPLTHQTRGMIDARALGRMKSDAVLVNCARGGVVDEEALLAALDGGRIRAAAIDVVSHEPPLTGSSGAALQRHDRVVATPHLGGSTYEALERIAVELARDVADALTGRPPAGAVNAPAAGGADAERIRAFIDVADRLGRLMPQLYQDVVRLPLRMTLAGELAGADPEALRTAFLAALLQTTTERRVSIVNARQIAGEIGVMVEVMSDAQPTPYSSLLSVAAGDHRVAATVISGSARIVQIDRYELDAIPQGAWIVTRHRDVPGMVGRIGTILGEAGINISTMQVARDAGGHALMVLAVDRGVEAEQLRRISEIPGIDRVDAAVFS